MSAHTQRRLDGGRYRFAVAACLIVALGALGGASRADELQQPVVIFASLAAIAAALWPLDFSRLRDARGLIAAVALVYLLLLAQLVPLPPGLWSGLPGHGVYAEVARRTGSVGWRPLTVSPDLTLNAISGLVPATAAGLAALMLDLRGRIRLAQVVVGISCASAVLGLVQLASGGTAFHLFRTSSADSAVGLFANRNHQAALMACCLPLVAALATIRLREGAAPGRVIAATIAIVGLFLIAIAAAGSRMGLLLGAIGLVAAVAIYWRCGRGAIAKAPIRPALVAAGIFAGLAAILPISLLIARSGAIERLSSSQSIDQTRVAALAPMIEAARAFFPFGAGFGTFSPVFDRFEPNSMLSTIYLNQGHNEPVQLAIEGGLAAMLLLFLFLLWWLRSAIVALGRRESPVRGAMGMATAAGTLILLMSSLVDYPLRTPFLGGLFAIFCVELVRSSRRPRPVRAASRGTA